MAKTRKESIAPQVNWILPGVLTALPNGFFGRNLYEAVKECKLGNIGYDEQRGMWGSNVFLAARIDTIGKTIGFRAPTLLDLSRPEVIEMAGEYYIDAAALIVQSSTDLDPQNQALLKKIIPAVERKQGKVRFPFMVSGFDCKTAYDFTPRDDFAVVENERLGGKYSGSRFNEVDQIGIPIFNRKGRRTWYADSEGVSGVGSYGYQTLLAEGNDLIDSDHTGRIVLLTGGNNEQNFEQRVREAYESRQKALESRLSQALKLLRGE